jgi:DNA mismatch repair protein MutL
MAEGTVITVRNLFFNTPARLKFMKSSETEAGHVGDLLTKLAISRPDIRFTYINDGKTVFRALDTDLRERVATLLGRPLAAELYSLDSGTGEPRIRGLVARPECSRSASSHLYTYINGRFIRDKVVQHAVLQAYRNFLERGRYPMVVLFIELAAGEVDVNVHPTKHEVRFREQGRIHDAIQAAVETVLRGTPWLKQQSRPLPVSPPPRLPTGVSEARVAEVRELLADYRPPAVVPDRRHSPAAPQSSTPIPEQEKPLATAGGFFSSLTVIGQYNAAYIVCQHGTELVLIDQHAAHERVAFERLKTQFVGGAIESQGLLFADTLDFSFKEAATVRDNLAGLQRLGFGLEEFGGATWLVKAVPRFLAGTEYLRTLRDILEELQSLGRSRTFADVQEEILARIACHSVVRGNRPLSGQEISALFAQMDATDFSTNCPHGRPVLQTLTLAEIERRFKRL